MDVSATSVLRCLRGLKLQGLALPAHTHEIFHTLSREGDDEGLIAPPPPVQPPPGDDEAVPEAPALETLERTFRSGALARFGGFLVYECLRGPS